MKKLMACLCLLVLYCTTNGQDKDGLKLNQVQIIGSHNSYKKLPDPRVMKFLMKKRKLLGKGLDPIGIDYGQTTIDSQFTQYLMRGLEIDIYNDPKGGVFYNRRINALVPGLHQKSGVQELLQPGFKVLHIKDVDYLTYYYTFKEALVTIKSWSDAHPNHLPLFINIETKTYGPAEASGILRFLGFKRMVPFDAAACDSIDAEVKTIFGNNLDNILTPDRLRGKYASLDEMAKLNGWPLLDDCRGKIVFIMLGDAKEMYSAGHPSLADRAMCTYSIPGKPECAFIMKDNPIRDSALINQLVLQGYIVRTRADAETVEARNNDNTRKLAAFKSGAQIISTDYYRPDTRFSNFEVQWDGKHAGRANPVTTTGKSGEWVKE